MSNYSMKIVWDDAGINGQFDNFDLNEILKENENLKTVLYCGLFEPSIEYNGMEFSIVHFVDFIIKNGRVSIKTPVIYHDICLMDHKDLRITIFKPGKNKHLQKLRFIINI